jgi:hypothetical protein
MRVRVLFLTKSIWITSLLELCYDAEIISDRSLSIFLVFVTLCGSFQHWVCPLLLPCYYYL